VKQQYATTCASTGRLNVKNSGRVEQLERQLAAAAVRLMFVASELGRPAGRWCQSQGDAAFNAYEITLRVLPLPDRG